MESYGIMVFREYMTCTTVPGKKQTTAPGTAWPSNLTPASVQIGEVHIIRHMHVPRPHKHF